MNKLKMSLIDSKNIFGTNAIRIIFKNKIDEVKEEIKQLKIDIDEFYKKYAKENREVEKWVYKELCIEKTKKEIEQLEVQKFIWNNKLTVLNGGKNRLKYDIEAIKKIPIRQILIAHGIKIFGKNVFKIRNERTPSCHFNEDKNLWIDFGTQEGGSVIDLYMKLNNCSFREAIKELTK